jgi:hypothetical protein
MRRRTDTGHAGAVNLVAIKLHVAINTAPGNEFVHALSERKKGGLAAPRGANQRCNGSLGQIE